MSAAVDAETEEGENVTRERNVYIIKGRLGGLWDLFSEICFYQRVWHVIRK